MNESSITQIRNNLKQLRQQIENLGSTVNQQQQTLITTRADMARQAAAQSNDELARVLIHVRRTLEDLERRVVAQEKEQEQLKALQELGAVINSSLDLDQVLGIVMDSIIRLTKSERSMLLLRDDDSGELDVQVYRNIDQATLQKSSFDISRSIVRSVFESGEPVVTMNAQSDPRFAAQESIISYNLRSILCVPLMIKETSIGVIYADNRVAAGIFGDTDRDLLAAFANQAAVAIENARLFQQIRAHLIEITEMRDLMNNVFESIASGVITIDEGNRIALYNRAAERILGAPAKSVIEQTYNSAMEMLQLPVELLIDQVRTNGGTQSKEVDLVVRRRPGVTTLNLTLSPLLRDIQQDTLGVAMVLDDVSEKKRLESVRRYLPPALVDQVRDLDAAQRPQRRQMSVLFADVRGFSTYSENLDPEKLIQVINGYFTEAVNSITHFQGLTDKFMGDAVMALFNTPLNPQEDHAERAIRTAWMISQKMDAYLEALPVERRLHFGFGIHTGEAVVGNVGSHLRKDYSAIGDAVNLSKRIQEYAKADQILMSSDTYAIVKDIVEVEPLPPTKVKGRKALEQIYMLVGVKE
ncbi:MAG: GAF domain-containing protein [Chloroflexi bacterium]|nr:GAF domain-containing protein [Chloroflexota bacterium]